MADDSPQPSMVGDARFFAMLSELAEMHTDRSRSYGIYDAQEQGFADDPLSNQRYASPDFGIDAWVYALMRANECMRRLQGQVITSEPGNADLRKSFLDLASHTLIALVFYEEDVEAVREAFALDDDEDE